MKKTGIALSGGGARGIAHVGILKAMDEAGIKISMMSGTSSGAIVGLLYCSGYAPDSIMEIIKETNLIKYMRPAVSLAGLLKMENIMPVFREYLRNDSFEALNIPLVVAATNIRTATTTYFQNGPLIKSVLASCAVPVIFEPVKMNSESYIDGGVLNNLPVEPLIGLCDVIIASNCNPVSQNFIPTNMKALVERTLLMAIGVNTYLQKDKCSLFLEPERLQNTAVSDFSKAKDFFMIGYEYGKTRIQEILELVEH